MGFGSGSIFMLIIQWISVHQAMNCYLLSNKTENSGKTLHHYR